MLQHVYLVLPRSSICTLNVQQTYMGLLNILRSGLSGNSCLSARYPELQNKCKQFRFCPGTTSKQKTGGISGENSMYGRYYRSHLSPSIALIPHTVPETLPRDASLSPHKGHFHIPDFTPLQRIFIPWDAGIAIFWAAFLQARGFWLYFIYFMFGYVAYGLLQWEDICFKQQLWTNYGPGDHLIVGKYLICIKIWRQQMEHNGPSGSGEETWVIHSSRKAVCTSDIAQTSPISLISTYNPSSFTF